MGSFEFFIFLILGPVTYRNVSWSYKTWGQGQIPGREKEVAGGARALGKEPLLPGVDLGQVQVWDCLRCFR